MDAHIRKIFVALTAVALALAGCSSTPAGTGQIPSDQAQSARVTTPPVRDYRLAPGDQIEFRVVDAPNMDTLQQIRADGRITLPMIPDVVAAGKTLQELRKDLQQEYVKEGYLKAEAVDGINLIIKESAANKFFVGGQVTKDGAYTYSEPTTLTRAIIEAGGMTEAADPTRVVVIRDDGSYQVIDVKKVLAGNFGNDVRLQPMDTVYVPTSSIGDIDTFVNLYIKNVLPVTPGVGVAKEF